MLLLLPAGVFHRTTVQGPKMVTVARSDQHMSLSQCPCASAALCEFRFLEAGGKGHWLADCSCTWHPTQSRGSSSACRAKTQHAYLNLASSIMQKHPAGPKIHAVPLGIRLLGQLKAGRKPPDSEVGLQLQLQALALEHLCLPLQCHATSDCWRSLRLGRRRRSGRTSPSAMAWTTVTMC